MTMTYDIKAHHQALYDAMEPATNLPIYHTQSSNEQTGEPAEIPFIVYRQETERTIAGTRTDGSAKVLRNTWVLSVFSKNFGEALDELTALFGALTDAEITTSDGYETTNLEPIGVMSLWESNQENYAVHGRISWERSK
jgi:hypothetical protein